MVAIPKRRHGSGEWIMRWMAENADVRSVSDALAFLLCGALVAALGWMVTHPGEFYGLVMGWLS